MKPKLLPLLLTLIVSTFSPLLHAQTELRARYQDEFLPVVNVIGVTKYVLQDGKKREAGYTYSALFDTDSFGEGFVKIEDVNIEDKQFKKKGSATKEAANNYFTYEATLTSETDLGRCIAVLTFGISGTPTVYVESVGTLNAGKTRKIKFEIYTRFDTIGRLHIFSDQKEIRSTQVPDNYKVIEDEYAAFREDRKSVPVSTLLARQVAYPHRLSPSGRYIVTFRDDGKTNRILIFDLEAGSITNEIELGEYNERIYSLNWVDEDSFVFVLDEKLHLGHRNSDKVEVLMKQVDWISSMLPHDPDKILINSTKPNTYIVYNLANREKELKSNIGDFDKVWWDNLGVARIKMLYKGEDVRFYHRWDATGKWKPLDDIVTQEGLQFDYSGSNALNQTIFIDGFSKEIDKLYVYYNDDQTTNKFAEFDLSTGKISKPLLASKTYDLGGLDYIPETAVLRRASDQQVIGIRYIAEKPATRWYHPDFEYVQELFDNQFPDTVNLPIDWTDDGTVIIFSSINEKHPGKYYAFIPTKRQIFPLWDRLPPLADYELGDMSPISYPARDGYTIHGYLTTPPNYDGTTQLPTVIMPHGGPWVRDIWSYDAEVQFFATRGFAVLQPNYRGSVGYGAPHMKAGIGNIDTVMIDDIADATKHFIDSGVIDPKNVFIYGHSYGGYAVYMSLIRYPEIYKAGVAISAVSHYGEQIKHRKGNNYGYGFWTAALGSHKDKELMERVSPYFQADKIKAPLRIYHGMWDSVVPVEQSELMEKALKDTDVDYDVTYFHYEGHSFRSIQNISRYIGDSEAFFRENFSN